MDLTTSPQEFFKEQLTHGQNKVGLKLSVDVEFYLVQLLCDYIRPMDNQSQDGLLKVPLALMLKEALEAPREQQLAKFKAIGDTSLYVSGYFPDYFNHKTFTMHYYMNLGAGAYSEVANIVKEKPNGRAFGEVYVELADNFVGIADLFSALAEKMSEKQDKNVLAIYDRWTKSRSERLRRQLEECGIQPMIISKEIQ